MHCTFSSCSGFFPIGFSYTEVFNDNGISNTPLLWGIYKIYRSMCVLGQRMLWDTSHVCLVWYLSFGTMPLCLKISLSFELLYNLQHRWGAYVQWGLQADIGWPTYMSIKAGNTVEASISQSRIDSRANIHEHQEGNTIEVSILQSGIDRRPKYVSINILGLV